MYIVDVTVCAQLRFHELLLLLTLSKYSQAYSKYRPLTSYSCLHTLRKNIVLAGCWITKLISGSEEERGILFSSNEAEENSVNIN